MAKSIYSNDYLLFCALLAEERLKNNLSQAQLAEKLGKPQSFVAKYENGERRIDIIEFLMIMEAFGSDPQIFLHAFLLKRQVNT